MVSVASQVPNSPQKSVSLPLNMAHLGHQILLQQSTATSPAKVVSIHSTAQLQLASITVFLNCGPLGPPELHIFCFIQTLEHLIQLAN